MQSIKASLMTTTCKLAKLFALFHQSIQPEHTITVFERVSNKRKISSSESTAKKRTAVTAALIPGSRPFNSFNWANLNCLSQKRFLERYYSESNLARLSGLFWAWLYVQQDTTQYNYVTHDGKPSRIRNLYQHISRFLPLVSETWNSVQAC